jgi:signal transduction histidine kinase
MVDITDRKKTEEERLKSHMLESIGILAGGIAHDFNNLLNIINGDIHVAKTFVQTGDKAYNRLADAEQICEIAGDLTKRLITFATGGDPVKKTMSISGMITDTVGSLLKNASVTPAYDLPKDLFAVAIDEGQMQQVFRNLVLNAIEAMPQGGTLAVRGENIRVTAGDSIPMREGNYLKISIQDSGVGIPAENLPKVFDPYFSTKDTFSQKGLGLGLAVCYSVVKRHDGLITVESELGKGTTFHIYLPAAK